MTEESVYYVYEWIRLDTNEPFYVGKGKGRRCYRLTRKYNKCFDDIVKTVDVAVNILHENLKEEMALGLEIYYIWLYRDIIGYDLVNITDGGEGCSLYGRDNPMYGRSWWDENTPKEKIDKWRSKLGVKGKNHHMYGKHHTEDTKRKMKESRIGKYYGKNAPNSRAVICLTTKKIFYTITEGAKYYKCDNSHITKCCKGKAKFCGEYKGEKLVWKFLNYKHNKKYRIKK